VGEVTGAYGLLVRNFEGKSLFGRSRRGWEGNMKVDLQEVLWRHGLDWSDSECGQVAGFCECGNELLGSKK
jgi:hypothetical protein